MSKTPRSPRSLLPLSTSTSNTRPKSASLVEKDKIILSSILGISYVNIYAYHPINKVYAVGCNNSVILYKYEEEREHEQKERNEKYDRNELKSERNEKDRIIITCTKTISSLSFSRNGKYLIIGELGYEPSTSIYDIENNNNLKLYEINSVNYAVKYALLSPNNTYLIIVSTIQTPTLQIYDWQDNKKIYEQIMEIDYSILSIDFSRDGNYFVTSSNKGINYYYISSDSKVTIFPGKLGEFENDVVISLVCSRALSISPLSQFVYCITANGKLLSLDSNKTLEKWVDIKMQCSNLSVFSNMLTIAGSINNDEGVIRVFAADNFKHMCTIKNPLSKFGGALLNENDLLAVCDDKTMIMYDITKPKAVETLFKRPSHTSVSDIVSALIDGKEIFISCGADHMIHFWNLKEKEHCIHTISVTDHDTLSAAISLNEHDLDESFSENESAGLKCIAISPLNDYFAVGDTVGKIRLYSLKSENMYQLIETVEAHTKEVTVITFSGPIILNDQTFHLFASGSRDRAIHVYDMGKLYNSGDNSDSSYFPLVSSMLQHSSSVSGLSFSTNGTRLISCSSDKSIIFRSVKVDDMTFPQLTKQALSKFTKLEIHPNQKFSATCGSDKMMHIWNNHTGKSARSYKLVEGIGSNINVSGVGSEPGKMCIDPSGLYVAISSNDKGLKLYDWITGKLITKVRANSESITSIAFSRDGSKILSASSDGCILVWILAPSLVAAIQNRLNEMNNPLISTINNEKEVKIDDIKADSLIVKIEKDLLSKVGNKVEEKIVKPEIKSLSGPKADDKIVKPDFKPAPTSKTTPVKKESTIPKNSPPSKVKPIDVITSVDISSAPDTKSISVSPTSAPKLKPAMKDIPIWARSVAPDSFPEILSDMKDNDELNISTISNGRPESKWAQRVHNENLTIFSRPNNDDDAILMSTSISDGDFLNTMVSNSNDVAFPTSNSSVVSIPPSIATIENGLVVSNVNDNRKYPEIHNNKKDESSISDAIILTEDTLNAIDSVKIEHVVKNVEKVSGVTLLDEDLEPKAIAYSAFDNTSIESFNKLQNDPFVDTAFSNPVSVKLETDFISDEVCLKTISSLETSIEESIKLFSSLSGSENSAHQTMKLKLIALVEKLNTALSLPNDTKVTHLSSQNIENMSELTSTLVADKLENKLMNKLEKLIADSIASAIKK